MRFLAMNDPGDNLFDLTPAQWDEAAARAGESGHEIRFGRSDAEFATGIAWADVLLAQTSTLYGRFPCTAPNLQMIFLLSAGVDKLQPFSNLPAGVAVLNNSGAHSRKAGEYAAMALLMLNARVPEMLAQQRDQVWNMLFSSSLRGRRVTVIGTGDMGAPAARAARLFGAIATGVRTKATPHPDFDRVVAVADLDSVLPETDFLILACPLTAATTGLVSRARLALLPKGAGVINIGRGGVLDQEALCDLLDAGHLGGAVLDVFTPEPIPPGHRTWTTKNLVISPHVSVDDPLTYNPDSFDILWENIRAMRAGLPMSHQVDLSRGY
ncbi:MAG: D-2-hydroxyacid dehydrogenase [Alphaproteobacteria bacterium]|nr:D-2-hydroxyacid dehydrogenase [Alphaproteobacteria bacterium]